MNKILLILLPFVTLFLISSPAFSEKQSQQERTPVFTNDNLKKHSYSNSSSDQAPSENTVRVKNDAPKEQPRDIPADPPPPKTDTPPPTVTDKNRAQ
jgi:hypothetical protein